jgi:transposase
MYDEKFRKRAVEYKDSGHTFDQLKRTFGISNSTYYTWKANKERTGFYTIPQEGKRTRRRKVDPQELKNMIDENPEMFLREIALKFNCSIPSIHKRLKELKITYKKNVHLFGKVRSG